MTDLEYAPVENDLRPEKRPGKFRVEKRDPARGKDTAERHNSGRRSHRGQPENDQEEGEEQETRGYGITTRTRGETEKEPDEEGEGKEQRGTQIPERITHAAGIATSVPSWGTGALLKASPKIMPPRRR